MAMWVAVLTLCMLAQSYETAAIGNKDLCKTLIFKLSLFSQRHTNGKWETHVELNGDNSTAISENERDMHLDVKQTITTCNCTKDILSVEANIIAPPPRPRQNYTLHSGLGYYFLQKTPQPSEEANVLCNAEGAHLTVIDSKEEADVVKNMVQDVTVQNKSQKGVFVGLYKHAGGDIITLYGNTYVLPEGIMQETPMDPLVQDNNGKLCGTINSQGKLNFVPCHWKLPSLCEQEL